MIKNNLLSFLFHGILSLLIFCLLWFTKDSPRLVSYLFGSTAGKALLLALICFFYFWTGRLLRSRSWLDVFTSSLLLLSLGFFLLLLAYGGLQDRVFQLEPAQSLWTLPLTLFCLPYTILMKTFGIQVSLWSLILAPLFPSCIFSLSQGLYLRKRKKRKRKLEDQRRTYV